MKDPLDEVTLFTVRPIQLPGSGPEEDPEPGAVFRLRSGSDIQERIAGLTDEVEHEIEEFAQYLYSTGMAVTMADGDLDLVDSHVAQRRYDMDDLQFAFEVEDVSEHELSCEVFTTSGDPDALEQESLVVQIMFTGKDLKEIATDICTGFGFDPYWLGL